MESKPYQNFTELELWKAGRSFNKVIFSLTKSFPDNEKYRLADQIIRSSRSVNANIAEGHGRYHYQEQIQFCRQARGSLSETLNHLYDALDCQYISQSQFDEIHQLFEQLQKKLNGYIAHLKNEKKIIQHK